MLSNAIFSLSISFSNVESFENRHFLNINIDASENCCTWTDAKTHLNCIYIM